MNTPEYKQNLVKRQSILELSNKNMNNIIVLLNKLKTIDLSTFNELRLKFIDELRIPLRNRCHSGIRTIRQMFCMKLSNQQLQQQSEKPGFKYWLRQRSYNHHSKSVVTATTPVTMLKSLDTTTALNPAIISYLIYRLPHNPCLSFLSSAERPFLKFLFCIHYISRLFFGVSLPYQI